MAYEEDGCASLRPLQPVMVLVASCAAVQPSRGLADPSAHSPGRLFQMNGCRHTSAVRPKHHHENSHTQPTHTQPALTVPGGADGRYLWREREDEALPAAPAAGARGTLGSYACPQREEQGKRVGLGPGLCPPPLPPSESRCLQGKVWDESGEQVGDTGLRVAGDGTVPYASLGWAHAMHLSQRVRARRLGRGSGPCTPASHIAANRCMCADRQAA